MNKLILAISHSAASGIFAHGVRSVLERSKDTSDPPPELAMESAGLHQLQYIHLTKHMSIYIYIPNRIIRVILVLFCKKTKNTNPNHTKTWGQDPFRGTRSSGMVKLRTSLGHRRKVRDSARDTSSTSSCNSCIVLGQRMSAAGFPGIAHNG